jgi:kynurenine formamidase
MTGAGRPVDREVVDLSHPIVEGMTTYPGIPGPTLGAHLTFDESAAHYAAGTEFSIGTISMAANTGTYLDTPAHRYRDGDDLSRVDLARMVDRSGVVVRARDLVAADRAIDEARLRSALEAAGVSDPAGRAVLIETGHSDRWGTSAYFTDHPYLTDDAVEFLVSVKPSLVGIDSLNIDSTHTGRRPAHTWLLAAGIPVVEHLTALAELPDTGFRFTAAPPAVVGMGTFTVRAFAVLTAD